MKQFIKILGVVILSLFVVGILTQLMGPHTIFSIITLVFCLIAVAYYKQKADESVKKLADYKTTLTPDEKELLSVSERTRKMNESLATSEQSVCSNELKSKLLDEEIQEKKNELADLNSLISQAKIDFDAIETALEYGLYRPQFRFSSSTDFKDELKKTRELEKNEIKKFDARVKKSHFAFNGDEKKGKRIAQNTAKLIMRVYNNEVDEIINKVKTTNATASLEKIHARAESLSKLANWADISIPTSYIKLKENELKLACEYAKFKEEEAEAVREARYQEREERKLQQEITAKRRLLEKEQKQYYQALQEAIAQYEESKDEGEKTAISIKLEELRTKVDDVDKAISDVDYREANQKAGYVYVISNIGSFGEDVYKIGMTRRLEPMDRIRELSDASVPFNFDVHALIFCDDAPALEAALHREFESKKVNLINQRREFFSVTLDEIEKVVKRNYDKTVDFIEVPGAEQYRESQKMKKLGISSVE